MKVCNFPTSTLDLGFSAFSHLIEGRTIHLCSSAFALVNIPVIMDETYGGVTSYPPAAMK